MLLAFASVVSHTLSLSQPLERVGQRVEGKSEYLAERAEVRVPNRRQEHYFEILNGCKGSEPYPGLPDIVGRVRVFRVPSGYLNDLCKYYGVYGLAQGGESSLDVWCLNRMRCSKFSSPLDAILVYLYYPRNTGAALLWFSNARCEGQCPNSQGQVRRRKSSKAHQDVQIPSSCVI